MTQHDPINIEPGDEPRNYHECELCEGDGFLFVGIDGDEKDCPECGGTGEWFD